MKKELAAKANVNDIVRSVKNGADSVIAALHPNHRVRFAAAQELDRILHDTAPVISFTHELIPYVVTTPERRAIEALSTDAIPAVKEYAKRSLRKIQNREWTETVILYYKLTGNVLCVPNNKILTDAQLYRYYKNRTDYVLEGKCIYG